MKQTFDIEDLSEVIRLRAEQRQQPIADEVDEDAITLPIRAESSTAPLQVDTGVRAVDSITEREHPIYRVASLRLLRYRVAVLGIGSVVEQLFEGLQRRLEPLDDSLVPSLDLRARFEVGLFGGQPRNRAVRPVDAQLLADRLAAYRPNCLVLVNAGQVRNRFADRSPEELAALTRRVNLGALAGQRPYSLVMVLDREIPAATFGLYWRACQTMNTFAATKQFSLENLPDLVEAIRAELRRYASDHLSISVS